MATAAFSNQPFSQQQHIEHQAKEVAATMAIALTLREVFEDAREKLFSRPDIDQVGATTSIGVRSLEQAFALAVSLAEADMKFGQQALKQLQEGPNAKAH